MPVTIVGVPTWRDADGLAMSSRNRYLRPEQRPTALALSARPGRRGASGCRRATGRPRGGRGRCSKPHPDLTIDRLDLVDPAHARRRRLSGPARLLVAGILAGESGPIRLIDNAALTPRSRSDHAAHDAEVEDPPRHRHPGRSALRRLGDGRRGPDGGGRPAARRAGRRSSTSPTAPASRRTSSPAPAAAASSGSTAPPPGSCTLATWSS